MRWRLQWRKMTLDTNDNGQLKYHLSAKKIYEDQYKRLNWNLLIWIPVKNKFDEFKEAVKKYQHAQVTIDDAGTWPMTTL